MPDSEYTDVPQFSLYIECERGWGSQQLLRNDIQIMRLFPERLVILVIRLFSEHLVVLVTLMSVVQF